MLNVWSNNFLAVQQKLKGTFQENNLRKPLTENAFYCVSKEIKVKFLYIITYAYSTCQWMLHCMTHLRFGRVPICITVGRH